MKWILLLSLISFAPFFIMLIQWWRMKVFINKKKKEIRDYSDQLYSDYIQRRMSEIRKDLYKK